MSIKKAVIPAAGLGTRFLPATKAMPKEMLPIVDKPTLQYIIEEAVASGIEEILIITGRGKDAIENHFDRSMELESSLEKNCKYEQCEQIKKIADIARIYYTRQKEPKGLGHAVSIARSFCGNEPFAVLLGDDIVDSEPPCLAQMIQSFERTGCTTLGVQQVPLEDVHKYGVVDVNAEEAEDRTMRVHAMIEKPPVDEAPSNFAVMGRYIITPAIFDILDQTAPGKGNEIQLTDALYTLSKTEHVYAYEFSGDRYDVGDKFGFIKANIEFALRRDALKDELRTYLQALAKTL